MEIGGNPYEDAEAYFAQECDFSLRDSIGLHCRWGYFHSTPDYLVMAYPCERALLDIVSRGPYLSNPNDDYDTWFIYYAGGNLSKAVEQFPFPLEWISWEVEGKRSVFKFDKAVRILARSHAHEGKVVKSQTQGPADAGRA